MIILARMVHRQFFHLENYAKKLGTVTIGPHLIKNSKKFLCDTSNYVPLVVPGLSTISSTSSSSTSPTSSSEETVIDTEIPATRRSGSTDELARGDPLHESAEIENPNRNDDDEEL